MKPKYHKIYALNTVFNKQNIFQFEISYLPKILPNFEANYSSEKLLQKQQQLQESACQKSYKDGREKNRTEIFA